MPARGAQRPPPRRPGPARAALLIALLLVGAAVPAAHAEAPAPSDAEVPETEAHLAPRPHVGSLSVTFDNDTFAGHDSRYSAGFSFVWTSAPVDTYGERNLQRRIVNGLSFLPTVGQAGYRNYLQFAAGMEMYTAENIKVAIPPPRSHPYAGILFLDTSVFSRSRISLHQLTLRLGLVGPISGAAEVQGWIHQLLDSPIPKGWSTQLGNEPLVNLFYQYSRRLWKVESQASLGLDVTANGGGGLGNYYIGGNLGLMGRAGFGIPDNYGVTPLLGGAECVVCLSPPRKRFFAYAFLTVQAFGVARWLPTDGNTFRDSRQGDRDAWIFSLAGGVVVGYSRVVLSYRYNGIAGLSDLKNIDTRGEDDFGTIMITVFFG